MEKTKEKGVTLITLVIAIIVLLVLASIGINSGVSTIKFAEYTELKNELQVLQSKVNELNQNNELNIGQELSEKQKNILNTVEVSNIIYNEKTHEEKTKIENGFKYCNSEYIQNNFGLETLKRDYLINVEYRYVVYCEGYEYEGTTYYMIQQFEDGLYNVEYNDKNTGKIVIGDINVDYLENNIWQISIDDLTYPGYVQKGTIFWQKDGETQWKQTTNKYFITRTPGKYNIKIKDANENTQIINKDGEEYDNDIVTVAVGINIEEGIILYYDAINNTGTGHDATISEWKDLSGNGYDGTLNGGATWGEDYLEFDGVDDYVDTNLATDGDFTIDYVAKDIDVTNSYEYASLFMINTWHANAGPYTSIQLFNDKRSGSSAIYGRFLIPSSSTSNYKEIYGGVVNNKQDSVHYTITKNDERIEFWCDGEKIAENTDSDFLSGINLTQINLQLGRWYGSSSMCSKHKVNAMRIYNRVLSDNEIQSNYHADINKYK